MKPLLVSMLSLVMGLLAGHAAGQDAGKPSLKALSWLAGAWEGDGFEEHWTTPVGGVMLGMGRFVKGDKTIFSEFIRIDEKDGEVSYRVLVDQQPEVAFKLVRQSDGESVFENKEHDFPQRIVYKQEGKDALTARIEGDQGGKTQQMLFKFTRVK